MSSCCGLLAVELSVATIVFLEGSFYRIDETYKRPDCSNPSREPAMVERKMELRRRRKRQEKMRKLKAKLAAAKTGGDREHLLQKIHRISPWWKEPVPAK
jgi:hypothetical protein